MKSAFEEEQEDTKKQITDLQYDLLELRDAHAKLRTTNEKLRRDKEKFEREMNEFRVIVSFSKPTYPFVVNLNWNSLLCLLSTYLQSFDPCLGPLPGRVLWNLITTITITTFKKSVCSHFQPNSLASISLVYKSYFLAVFWPLPRSIGKGCILNGRSSNLKHMLEGVAKTREKVVWQK